MPLMRPQARSRSGSGFWEKFGPGGEVINSASDFATQLGKDQLRSTFDPRTWNDPVTPQVDEQGRPISAGVVLPLGPGNQMVGQLQDILKMLPRSGRTNPYENSPLTKANQQTLDDYSDPSIRYTRMGDPRSRKRVVTADDMWAMLGKKRPYDQEGFQIDPNDLGPMPKSGLPVSWDQGPRPLPPEPVNQALDKLLEKLRPKQMKQMKIMDEDADLFGFDARVSPLERDNPRMFRQASTSEDWVADTKYDVGGQRLPGLGRQDVPSLMRERFGRLTGRDLDRQQNLKHKRVIDENNEAAARGEIDYYPPPNPHTYHPNYYAGAERNLVGRKHPLVQKLERISKGRRGGV